MFKAPQSLSVAVIMLGKKDEVLHDTQLLEHLFCFPFVWFLFFRCVKSAEVKTEEGWRTLHGDEASDTR